MAKTADRYFAVDPWKIIEEGFDPAYSRVSESVFSLANETMGVRGCFDEGGSVDSLRGAYTNGVYDLEPIGKSYRGIIDTTHFMIPSAEWLMTEIVLDGEKLDLSRNEYRILLTLMQEKGKIVSREKLMEALWQTDSFVDENTLTVNVGRLRRKLDAAGLKDFIVTKHGEGYLVG